jgi:hypothetical protein
MKDLQNNPVAQRNYYSEVFDTEAGQAVLLDLFKQAGLDRPTTHVPGDSHTSAYNEGMRAMVWQIMIKANQDVDPYLWEALKRS